MTVAGIKTIKVKPGMDVEFKKMFAEMMTEIRKNESGCLFFDLYQMQEDPTTYIVLERYVNEEANTAHKKSAHLAHYSPRIRALFDSIEVKYLDQVNL